jgi:hypothetical protein
VGHGTTTQNRRSSIDNRQFAMVLRLAFRSLAVRPFRTAILACGFGLGIAVMAVLLGVGEVILDQARAPALQGGGDLVISGSFGAVDSARFVLSSLLSDEKTRSTLEAASPSKRATLFLAVRGAKVLSVTARGGIPSLERALRDPEISSQKAWVDASGDERWAHPDPADVVRTMDRFHPQPEVPEFAASWAEWLYFNGRTADGRTRFYLTFMFGPVQTGGTRGAGVRLQLDRDGQTTAYSTAGQVKANDVLTTAPDLDIGGNHVRLESGRYQIQLVLADEESRAGGPGGGAHKPTLTGSLTLEAPPGRSLPPFAIHGARGWLTGYVVPVLSGAIDGALTIGDTNLSLHGGTGYHDHNWGFWKDVRWQWGQVAHDDLSFVYGRVFPPPSVADANHLPGFLGVLGRNGPIALSTDVAIREEDSSHPGRGAQKPAASTNGPDSIFIDARGHELDLHLIFSVDRSIHTQLSPTSSRESSAAFLQMGGSYHVSGRAGTRQIDFTARGAAETFRQSTPIP